MGTISQLFNFENIGGKIKDLAKWSCWITILLIWIATPILIIVTLVEGGVAAAFLSVILLPIAALLTSVLVWISSWTTYAFGEFVEDIHAMRHTKNPPAVNTGLGAESPTAQPLQTVVKPANPVQTPHHQWRCDACGKMRTTSPCEYCGKD